MQPHRAAAAEIARMDASECRVPRGSRIGHGREAGQQVPAAGRVQAGGMGSQLAQGTFSGSGHGHARLDRRRGLRQGKSTSAIPCPSRVPMPIPMPAPSVSVTHPSSSIVINPGQARARRDHCPCIHPALQLPVIPAQPATFRDQNQAETGSHHNPAAFRNTVPSKRPPPQISGKLPGWILLTWSDNAEHTCTHS
jgi:hypothetical protein